MASVQPDPSARFYQLRYDSAYPWQQWMDGRVWELTFGKDITEPLASFRTRLYRTAKSVDRHLFIKTRQHKDGSSLFIQAWYRVPYFGSMPLREAEKLRALVTDEEWYDLFEHRKQKPVIAKIEAALASSAAPALQTGQDRPAPSEPPAQPGAWTPAPPRPPQ